MHEIYSDPRVWTHFPQLRHVHRDTTAHMIERWIGAWDRDGLGPWIVRDLQTGFVLGHGGCDLREGQFWNLGYRFAAEAHGRGYATEIARCGLEQAHHVRPAVPVAAYLLEHNHASRRVAEKAGLTLRHRAPDAGNPDPEAVRLVLSDRPLTDEQLAATLR